jgi:hypothetical protein
MANFNLGEETKKILSLKAEEARLNGLVKVLNAERKELEITVVRHMQEIGIDRLGIEGANLSVQHKRLPQVASWDEFYDYIHSNNASYLMQRRVSSTAIDELSAEGIEIPGIEFYEEDRLSVKRS